MARVKIEAADLTVEVDDSGAASLADVRRLALDTFRRASFYTSSGSHGPAVGFTAERSARGGGFTWRLGEGGHADVSP